MVDVAKEHLPTRVELPLSEEEQAQVEEFKQWQEWYTRTKNGMLMALLRKGKPFTGVRKPKPKPTKHQRHMASVKARKDWLRYMRAMDEYAENTTHGGTWIGETV